MTRRDGRVWMEAVESWNPLEMTSSTLAAQSVAMKAVGEAVSYADLLGASATAFRLQVHEEWCPSSPHVFSGHKTIDGAVAALPWRVRAYQCGSDDAGGVDEARQAVMASVDRGVPCVYGSEEDGLIIGYQGAGEEWLCLHPYRTGTEPFVERRWPWGIGVFVERKTAPPDRARLAVGALCLAVDLAHTKRVEQYRLGFEAWHCWIAELGDPRRVAGCEAGERSTMQHGNWWIFTSLIDHRQAASSYLRKVALELPAPATHSLEAAANLYERVVAELVAGRAGVERPGGGAWRQAARDEQARVLEGALAFERQAVEQLEAALKACA